MRVGLKCRAGWTSCKQELGLSADLVGLHANKSWAQVPRLSDFLPTRVGLKCRAEPREEVSIRIGLRFRAGRAYVFTWKSHAKRCQYGIELKCRAGRAYVYMWKSHAKRCQCGIWLKCRAGQAYVLRWGLPHEEFDSENHELRE
ncbi:hypothetical protein F511_36804 [Dorcoceras hygrometricum]|uniref:Uncharacterized protein n=1 Tax=Dorcoceras hygrometricum TaxID=472368 RepID=A0A2Z7BKR2_9LAMI|nr:hypothetical protein F511_36804 [Dorcoceras hygrometricum]